MENKDKKRPRDMDTPELAKYLISLYLALGISPKAALDAMHLLLNMALENGKELAKQSPIITQGSD
jgi:hypothetical protein